ncbi:hypothetical protein WA026_007835, partial [Henosepilachna vigintioctopunctata]
ERSDKCQTILSQTSPEGDVTTIAILNKLISEYSSWAWQHRPHTLSTSQILSVVQATLPPMLVIQRTKAIC